MSTENKYTAPPMRVEKLSERIQVEISQQVYDQIKFLTRGIHKEEWSGILFYSVIGNISELEEFKIILEDILLMDKGTGAYTEYDYNEDVVEYRMNNPEALQWEIGHIHSHNTMGVFFSGTDSSEVHENSAFHNVYLSVIVNNRMQSIGKVVFRGSSNESPQYQCVDHEGENYYLSVEEDNHVIFEYDCEFTYPERLSLKDVFLQRYDAIIKKFDTKKKDKYPQIPQRTQTSIDDEPDKVELDYAWEDSFPAYWLYFGALGSEGSDIIDAMEDFEERIRKDAVPEYLRVLISNTGQLYERFFTGEVVDVPSLDEVIELLIEQFSTYKIDYPFLKEIIPVLKKYHKELMKGD